ncbi:MAG: GNAT family N-acetyltransferase [Bacteroidota bacterium]
MQLPAITIRPINENDNAAIAIIIRNSLKEFGANHPGTVYYDESTDHLSDVFRKEGSFYFVAEAAGKLLGGGGIYPTDGLPAGVCELVKMYLHPEARGLGLGKKLMQYCLDKAKTYGYQQIYLETMPELIKAVPMYEKFGFEYLKGPMGNSGHFGCAIQMLKKLRS